MTPASDRPEPGPEPPGRVWRALMRPIRPSSTRSTPLLWAKSLLNALLFFAIFMLALPWLAHAILPVALPFPMVLRTGVGGLLFAAGLGAWIACLDTFSRVGRGTPLPMDAPAQLVTSGLFAAVRNPIMAAELTVLWGEVLYLANLGVLLYAALLSCLAHLMVVRVEEPELRQRFGQAFEDYCRRVPRWVPHLRAQRGASKS